MTLLEMIKKYEKIQTELVAEFGSRPTGELAWVNGVLKDLKSTRKSPTKDDIENEVRRAIMSALRQEEYATASSLICSLEAMWS